jgi:hypothetical protein
MWRYWTNPVTGEVHLLSGGGRCITCGLSHDVSDRVPLYDAISGGPRCVQADGRCSVHGAVWTDGCGTSSVLLDVRAERAKQFALHGAHERTQDGTGPYAEWFPVLGPDGCPLEAEAIERLCRDDYEEHRRRHGAPTWMHLVREEVAEAFQENDPARLREELVQVAALAVAWVEQLDARRR